MEPKVRDSLRQLIVRYGQVLCDDPSRCEAMLRDLCGPHKREVNCLIIALKQRVAADLLAGNAGLPAPLLLDRLSKRLEDELGLTTETAHWAVETWALALGVIAEPPTKKTPPPPAPVTAFRDRLKDGSEGPEMIRLPAGEFLMGSPDGDPMGYEDERPQHKACIVAEPAPMAAATAVPPRVQTTVAIHRPEPVGAVKGPNPASVPAPTPKPAPAPQPPPAKKTPPPPAPLTAFRDRLKDGSEGPEMVRLTPGEFLMGAADGDTEALDKERPQHKVRIARPFAIGRFPVTFEEYDRFVLATRKRGLMGRLFGGEEGKQPKLPGDQGWGRGRRPVINVSWDDAVAYCVWLSAQTGQTYRLPTEAEWEYACRAGSETRWSCGDDEEALGDHAWFSINSWRETCPVGEKRPNPWGLHDLHGNVWEWVQDHWHNRYQGAPTDGSAWESAPGATRVVRGGGWDSDACVCCCAYRYAGAPGDRNYDLGFRCARVQES